MNGSSRILAVVVLVVSTVVEAEEGGTDSLRVLVVDASNRRALSGALLQVGLHGADELRPPVPADSAGFGSVVGLTAGVWEIVVSRYGYEDGHTTAHVPLDKTLVVALAPRPIIMGEMLVHGRFDAEDDYAAAFVEVIPIAESSGALSLAEVLDRSTGVRVKRYGGLGSFSTVSIRGSTAEQVLVFLDGVPLNHAVGGAVDMGRLPLSGVESVEVYRGAVPARYGGNSIGGVVHIRTVSGSGARPDQLQITAGSFGSAMLTSSAVRQLGSAQLGGLVDFGRSRNDFRFLDDNGTEYNSRDDAWVERRNSDFKSVRALSHLRADLGSADLRLRNAFDLKHQGVPGLGNFQTLHTRFDGWRNITEVEVFGSLHAKASGGYRLVGYHAFQRDAYADPLGEVGTGVQKDRNDTRSFGLRTELNVLLRRTLASGFVVLRREVFDPADFLRPDSELLASRRRAATVGLEAEIAFAERRVRFVAGGQIERIADKLAPGYHGETWAKADSEESQSNTQGIAGFRVGGQLGITDELRFKWHRGRYERPPSFYELFGDRGAVVGSRDLLNESAITWDAGFAFTGSGAGWRVNAELSTYRNQIRNLIRFVQNSQFISRPLNIGEGRIQGVETRVNADLPISTNFDARYAYQLAENRSPLLHEQGNDLPNSPRHTLHVNVGLPAGPGRLRYELSRESSHFLDRANLRPVSARIVHGATAIGQVWTGAELKVELRNLSNDQVVDLWGYPLPGRSLFISLTQRKVIGSTKENLW